MNESKTSKIKAVIAKIDIGKLADYSEKKPNSKILREIIRYSKRILDSEKEQEISKLAVSLAYDFDTIVNVKKYVENDEEKKFWLGISEELFENTVGVKNKK
jgi:hypothetical protein